MSSITGNIGTIMLHPHQFQTVLTYRVVKNGKTEEVIRKGAIQNCCVKIGSKHAYMIIDHPNAHTSPLSLTLKKAIADLENIKLPAEDLKIRRRVTPRPINITLSYPNLISRKVINPSPASLPAKPIAPPQITPQQINVTLNALNSQICRLSRELTDLTLQLLQEKKDKTVLRALIKTQETKINALEAELTKVNTNLSANREELAKTRADLADTRQILIKIINLLQ